MMSYTIVLLSSLSFGTDPREEARAALAQVEREWAATVKPQAPPVIKESRSFEEERYVEEEEAEEEERPLIEASASSPQAKSKPVPPANPAAHVTRTWAPPVSVALAAPAMMSRPVVMRRMSAPMMMSGSMMGGSGMSSGRLFGGMRMMSPRASGGCST